MGSFLAKQAPVVSQVEDYLYYCEFKKRFTPDTLKTKRQAILKFLDEHPKLHDLRKLTNAELDHWSCEMVKKGLAGKTVNNYTDHVIACLRYMQVKKSEKISICFDKLERAQEDPPTTYYFTDEQIYAIKNNCLGLRELLLISLIFESALRIHEVAKMEVKDVKGRHIEVVGKGRKKRDTFILPGTAELLQRWIVLIGAEEGYIFPSPLKFGEHMTIQQLRQSINAPIRRAGFEQGSAHAVRHSSITAQLTNGLLLVDAQRIAGHSDPQTTQGYYHVETDRLGERHARAMALAAK